MTPFSNRQDRPEVHLTDGEVSLENEGRFSNNLPSDTIPDHAAAFAECLRRGAKQIANGRSAEDVANELLPVVRIAARRI